jgi:hypothetical protein
MASLIRQPFAITAALKQIPKASIRSSTRSFHQITPLKSRPNTFSFTAKTATSSPLAALSRNAFRRTYQQPAALPAGTGNLRQRLLYGAGIFGSTVLAINLGVWCPTPNIQPKPAPKKTCMLTLVYSFQP